MFYLLVSYLECRPQRVLEILLTHESDVGLHGLGGDGVGPEGEAHVLVARDLLDHDVSQDVLRHVLDVEHGHQGGGQLVLDPHIDVGLQHPAEALIVVPQELAELLVVSQRKDIDGLELTLQANTGGFSSR